MSRYFCYSYTAFGGTISTHIASEEPGPESQKTLKKWHTISADDEKAIAGMSLKDACAHLAARYPYDDPFYHNMPPRIVIETHHEKIVTNSTEEIDGKPYPV